MTNRSRSKSSRTQHRSSKTPLSSICWTWDLPNSSIGARRPDNFGWTPRWKVHHRNCQTLERLLRTFGSEVGLVPLWESALVLLPCFPPEPVRVATGTGRVATMTHHKPQSLLTRTIASPLREWLTSSRDSTLSPMMDLSLKVVRRQRLQIVWLKRPQASKSS